MVWPSFFENSQSFLRSKYPTFCVKGCRRRVESKKCLKMFHTVLTWHFQSCHSRILRKYQSVPQNHLRHCGLVEKFAWNTVLIICSVKVEFEPSRMKRFWHFALFEIFKETSTIIFMLRIFKISSLATFLIAVENVWTWRKLDYLQFQ